MLRWRVGRKPSKDTLLDLSFHLTHFLSLVKIAICRLPFPFLRLNIAIYMYSEHCVIENSFIFLVLMRDVKMSDSLFLSQKLRGRMSMQMVPSTQVAEEAEAIARAL